MKRLTCYSVIYNIIMHIVVLDNNIITVVQTEIAYYCEPFALDRLE